MWVREGRGLLCSGISNIYSSSRSGIKRRGVVGRRVVMKRRMRVMMMMFIVEVRGMNRGWNG